MTAVMTEATDPARTIAFQGAAGAYSDLACRRVFPDMTTLPCAAFEDAFGQSYDSSHWRSCPAKTIKCGSPKYWHLHGTVQVG